jgi:CheY-like chemotaxis protein
MTDDTTPGDDSAVARHKVATILRSLECDVVEMTGGQTALDKLETNLPDLLTLDINMPNVTSLHVLERGNDRHAKMPVVMLTGEADMKVVARPIALKADYIRKDDPVGSIKDRMSEHLEKRRSVMTGILDAIPE